MLSILRPIKIIQGGMGIFVSTPWLAKAVALLGGLGTVSGVAAHIVVARLLQMGDVGGFFRRAFDAFPDREKADRVYKRYYRPDGIQIGDTFKSVSVFNLQPPAHLVELAVLAGFSLVWLAKEGHDKPISINLMAKLELSLLPILYGAMLAHVDFVTVGAGMPDQVPACMKALMEEREALYRLTVDGKRCEVGSGYVLKFNPRQFFGEIPVIHRLPGFLPIVSGHTLAMKLVEVNQGEIAGFVVSPEDKGGGHKVLPRGQLILNAKGEPVYGVKDKLDIRKINALGIPWYLAGDMASPEALAQALELSASGVQIGSAFATCDQSGWVEFFKAEIRGRGYCGELEVLTDPRASPTGFGLNIAQLPRTLSDPLVYDKRDRRCDVCCLVSLSLKGGKPVFLCPAEPFDSYYQRKGGVTAAEYFRCLCNALLAAVGLGNPTDAPLFTYTKEYGFLRHLMPHEGASYGAGKVFEYMIPKK